MLTRAEQNEILEPVARACRVADYEMGDPNPWNQHSVQSFRNSLRLDDPVLAELVWRGAHRRPWSSAVPA